MLTGSNSFLFPASPANSSDSRRMCVTILILNDDVVEGNESFTLSLVSASSTEVIISPSIAVITILDDDGTDTLVFV